MDKLDEKGKDEWVVQVVGQNIFNRIRAKLVLSNTKDFVGKCSIEVWAEDECCGDMTEMAYCRALVCPSLQKATILWLGRSGAETVHQRARAKRIISSKGEKYTLSEALLGVTVSIASLFKVSTLELQAKDNGSGKLIDLYGRLGFTKRPQEPGEILWMEAPMKKIAAIAPDSWLEGLVPVTFDATGWLESVVGKWHFKDTLEVAFKEDVKWSVSWPSDASVTVKLSPWYGGSFRSGEVTRVVLETALVDSANRALAWASANVRLDTEVCRLIWVGRPNSQAVHDTVRGKRIFSVKRQEKDRSCEAATSVTAAIALVGVCAALAQRLGAKVFNLTLPEGSSESLARYFSSFGLVNSKDTPEQFEGKAIPLPRIKIEVRHLAAPCSAVMQRCLPADWESQVPLGTLKGLAAIGVSPKKGAERNASSPSKRPTAQLPAAEATRLKEQATVATAQAPEREEIKATTPTPPPVSACRISKDITPEPPECRIPSRRLSREAAPEAPVSAKKLGRESPMLAFPEPPRSASVPWRRVREDPPKSASQPFRIPRDPASKEAEPAVRVDMAKPLSIPKLLPAEGPESPIKERFFMNQMSPVSFYRQGRRLAEQEREKEAHKADLQLKSTVEIQKLKAIDTLGPLRDLAMARKKFFCDP